MPKYHKSNKRVFGGRLAQIRGKSYENMLEHAARGNGCSILNLPSHGGRFISKKMTARQKMPFDCIIGLGGKTAVLDVKSVKKDTNFSFSQIHEKPHQLISLILFYAGGNGCVNAGMIVFFEKHKKCVFFNTRQLSKVTPRSSIGPDEGLLIGNIDQPIFRDWKFHLIFEQK